jgi:hypothetical protein
LNLLGTCSTCGPGTSLEAEKKLAAQSRLLGSPCPILACANLNQVQFCLRDCSQFPCQNFSNGPYPFSKGYLAMQKRRRKEIPPAYAPDNTRASADPIYWEELQAKDLNFLCNLTLFNPVSDEQLSFTFLNENILVDIKDRCLKRHGDRGWEKTDDPLLELVTVLYLNGVTGTGYRALLERRKRYLPHGQGYRQRQGSQGRSFFSGTACPPGRRTHQTLRPGYFRI